MRKSLQYSQNGGRKAGKAFKSIILAVAETNITKHISCSWRTSMMVWHIAKWSARLRVVSSFPLGDRRESNLERWESARKVGRGQKKRGSILDDLLEEKRRLLAVYGQRPMCNMLNVLCICKTFSCLHITYRSHVITRDSRHGLM